MEITKSAFTDLFKKGIKIHIIFLTGLFLITVVITLQSAYYKDIAPRAALIYVLMVSCIYTGRWLTQRFLIKSKWMYLLLFICMATVIFSATGIFSMMYLMGQPEGSDISGFVVVTPLLVILTLFTGGLIAITRIVIRQQVNELKILHHQKQTELSLLGSRLSPHFLFNTLNNLYGLSIHEHQKVPGLLLKLSDLLSYALYSSEEPFVRLENEVAYIRNFIDLERIRMSDRLLLTVDVDQYDPNIEIAPMVLIIFVENAFKHARNTLQDEIQISMRLWTEQQNIHFVIENTCANEITPDPGHANSGLGIATTIKRLDLLYGNKYQLTYGKEKNTYRVNLEIQSNAKP